MARSKKRFPTPAELVAGDTWEQCLDALVSPEAAPDEYYKLAQEKIRAYVKELEYKAAELERLERENLVTIEKAGEVAGTLMAEIDRLKWMLHEAATSFAMERYTEGTPEQWACVYLAKLEARYKPGERRTEPIMGGWHGAPRKDNWKRRAEQLEAELAAEKQRHIDVAAIWGDKEKSLASDIRELEAELAALKARRCEGCVNFGHSSCPLYTPPGNFSCSSWEALP